jgi:hypothetical protein
VRRRFEERFTAHRMARDYIKIYEQVTAMGVRRAADGARETIVANGSPQIITRPDDIRPLRSRSDV